MPMLEGIPTPIREFLWQLKHSGLRSLQAREYVEYSHGTLQKQLANAGIDLVIDVGANAGQYGRLVRRLGYTGQIISFEPIEAMHAQVSAQARRDGRWTVERFGIGDTEGELELNVMKHSEFSSFLRPSADGAALFRDGTSVLRTERCPVRRLDSLLPRFVPDHGTRRIHLKTDTQGYDMRVIRGLGAELARVRSLQIEAPIVSLYEADGSLSDTFAAMRDAGLSLTGLFPVSKDKSLRIIELDCLFIRAEGA